MNLLGDDLGQQNFVKLFGQLYLVTCEAQFFLLNDEDDNVKEDIGSKVDELEGEQFFDLGVILILVVLVIL